MSSFDIRHSLNISADDFWEKVFFDQEFNQKLYKERLGFPKYEILEDETRDGGKRERKIKIEPKAEAPKAIKKVIGDSIEYVERGTFDPSGKRYTFEIETSKLSDKINISGHVRVEPKGDKMCERIVHTDAEVKVFGLGKIGENFIEKSTRESYDDAAKFTNEWISDKGL